MARLLGWDKHRRGQDLRPNPPTQTPPYLIKFWAGKGTNKVPGSNCQIAVWLLFLQIRLPSTFKVWGLGWGGFKIWDDMYRKQSREGQMENDDYHGMEWMVWNDVLGWSFHGWWDGRRGCIAETLHWIVVHAMQLQCTSSIINSSTSSRSSFGHFHPFLFFLHNCGFPACCFEYPSGFPDNLSQTIER